jgi:hypothetical protein
MEAAGFEPVTRRKQNPKQVALLPANALISLRIVPPLRSVSSRLVPFNSPLEGHTGGTCGPTGSSRSQTRAARVPRSPKAHEEPVGGGRECVPWRGVAGEGQVVERGWAYRRRQPEGTVLYEAVRDHLATLLADASEVGRGLTRYVERGFARYLECGVLAKKPRPLSSTRWERGLGRLVHPGGCEASPRAGRTTRTALSAALLGPSALVLAFNKPPILLMLLR